MNVFLQQQRVKNEERRNKSVRRLVAMIQRISLVVLIWSFGLGCIYGLYQLVFERAVFVVKSIEVEGNLQRLSDEEVKALSGIAPGSNLFSVNLGEVQKKISTNPWVREAAVARKLPGTIWIYVNEYAPFALMFADDVYLLDDQGRKFKRASPGDDKNFPAITGAASEDEINEAISLLKTYLSLPIADYFMPAEINIDEAHGYSMLFAGSGLLVRLGFDGMSEKLERLYSMLSVIDSNRGKIRYVDLNIPGKVVVKYES